MRYLVVAAVVTVALLSSCGGSPDAEGGRAAAGAVATSNPADRTDPPTPVRAPPGTEADAERIVRALVDGDRVYVRALGGGCTQSAAVTATETVNVVTLHLDAYVAGGEDAACPTDLVVWTQSVRLSQPLDGRRLVDADSGTSVPYIDAATLATVGWLPNGASEPVTSLDYGWTRTFLFPAQPDAAPLEISQGPVHLVNTGEFSPEAGTRAEVQIHDTTGTLVTQRSGRNLDQDRLGWIINGTMFVVQSQPTLAGQRPLPPSVIERIARGLQIDSAAS